MDFDKLLEKHWNTVQVYYIKKNTETGENRTYQFTKEEHYKYFRNLHDSGSAPDDVIGMLTNTIHEMENGPLWYHAN